MVLTHEQKRVRDLLTETVTLLCKNGLQFKSEIGIEALIGITLDGNEVFLVSIKEKISSDVELHEDSLLGHGNTGEAGDDEVVPTSEICVGVKTSNESVQPSGKARKTRRDSGIKSDTQWKNLDVCEKASILKCEEINRSDKSAVLDVAGSYQHSNSGICSYTCPSSEMEIKNSFPSGNVAGIGFDAASSNDSCIIEIKHENAVEEFTPYMELDSFCANSGDDLNGSRWNPDGEGTDLFHDSSGNQAFPISVSQLHRKKNRNLKSKQTYAMVNMLCAGKPAESDAHRCPICGLVSANWNLYLHHIRKHQPGMYRCPFCGRSFSGSTNLRGHLALHTNVREFACHLCDKAYAYKRDLIEHLILKHDRVTSRQSCAAPSVSTENDEQIFRT